MHSQVHSPAVGPSPVRGTEQALADADGMEPAGGDRSFVMSFARGMAVIHAFAERSRALSIADISHRTEIPRAAVRRLLHTLVELGYVGRVGSHYVLTPKTLELGYAFTSSNQGALGAQALVARLAERLDTFCAVSLQEGDETMLLCVAGSTQMPIGRRPIPCAGGKSPLYTGASGLVFLSEHSEAELDAYFERVAMRPLTFRTPTLPAQLRPLLAGVRDRGYAVSDRTFDEHLRSVAMPVRDRHGHTVAALLVVLQAEKMTEQSLQDLILPPLRQAVRELALEWA